MTIKLEDLIPGGKAENIPKKGVNRYELEKGIKVEMEHTDSKAKAEEIARDHLVEDPNYYSKLEKAGLADELDESKVGDLYIEIGETIENMEENNNKLLNLIEKFGLTGGPINEQKVLLEIRNQIKKLKKIFSDGYDFNGIK